MTPAAPEVLQVAEAVHRAFALDNHSLPDAFRPAHLAVALIDAVFASGLKPGETPEPAAARYCRRFGLPRTHEAQSDGDDAPEQEETLGRMVERYAALGVRGMAEEAYGSRRHFPGTRRTRSECVLRAVRAFVAGALGRRGVGATRAVGLVRAAAYELVLAPRFVDHAIWRAAMAAGGACGEER